MLHSDISGMSWSEVYTPTASLIPEIKLDHYEVSGTLSFDTPRTTFYFEFPRFSWAPKENDIVVEWMMDGKSIARPLDVEDLDMRTYEDHLYSGLLVTPLRSEISFHIRSKIPLKSSDIVLISSDTATPRNQLTFSWFQPTDADTLIVSRKDWGADESLRYKDSKYWKPYYEKLKLKPIVAPSEEKLTYDASYTLKRDYLEAHYSMTEKAVTVLRKENGHPLVWPITKMREVNRIVLHHTAESLDTIADDETLLRAIYQYHTNKWGDIGYNYIIGQRGKIYEGRAGGDYVVGAHVLGNNNGSVSISTIGNFQNIHLNRDQRAGLETAISYVATKYGITLSAAVMGFHPCSGTTCGEVSGYEQMSLGLVGHRDLTPTACPGNNIHSEIPGFITKLDRPLMLIDNPVIWPIELPLEWDEAPYQILIGSSEESASKTGLPALVPNIASLLRLPKLPSPVQSLLSTGPEVKVKLSYPTDKTTLELESATSKNAILQMGKRKVMLKSSDLVVLTPEGSGLLIATVGKKKYTSSSFALQWDLVRIPSWTRIPSWDTSRKYNDNTFRTRIVVRNDGGKLLVVNELPLEYYLKGMGEVSEGDAKSLPEKSKTIVVAARSYALYYRDPTLTLFKRKFPGKPYDVSDDPDESQKYLGYGYEMRSPTVAKLVDDTNREVVWYKGNIVKVWYASSTDGKTLSYKAYCEAVYPGKKDCEDIPYLQSVDDPGAVGKSRLGHGVGLSGVGATYFAQQGWDYKKILTYYLTGVEVKKK